MRYHKKMRKRSFHPLHRGSGAPLPTTLHPWRMTIQFKDNERKLWLGNCCEDAWSEETTWCGFSVFKQKDMDLGTTATSMPTEPAASSSGDAQMPVVGQQGPMDGQFVQKGKGTGKVSERGSMAMMSLTTSATLSIEY